MLGGQFRAIRAKPQTSKFGTLKKPTDVKTLKKETQARVSDVLGKPKKSVLKDTKIEIKKQAETEAARVEALKKAQEAKTRAETSKITASESFLTKLSSVLGIKKSALKVKDKETIIADTNAKIKVLQREAIKDAENEATVAKNIKIETNKNILTQKVNDLNNRISTLKNNFFSNINNIFARISPPNRIRDNASGRIDKIRTRDAEVKAKRLNDSESKNKNNENDATNKTNTAKDNGDINPLTRGIRLEDAGPVKKKAKDAEDDAKNQANKDSTKNEIKEKDGSIRAKDDARALDTPRKALDSDDARIKAKKADDDAKRSKEKDENAKNKSDTEAKKVENAKNDTADLGGPRKKFDSENVKKKGEDADAEAKRSKDADAESKKKDAEQRKKTEEAEAEARRLRDTDDSKKVKDDAENQKKKDSDQNKKAKNDNDGMAKVRDGLSKLSNLLGLIGTVIGITGFPGTTPEPPKTFCQKFPTHQNCIRCIGPLCTGGPTITYEEPEPPNYTLPPRFSPRPAPKSGNRSPFSAPEFGDILIYLLFTIQNNPENDISILLEPNDEKIRFIDTQISFPKAEWETTVKIPCYISIPDLSGNEEFESLPVDEKVATIKKKKKKKRVEKDQVSITAYYPTKKQIDILETRLRYLLDKSDTDLEKALQKIQENIRIKRQLGIYESKKKEDDTLVEPTLDSSEYDEVKEDVEPTYDDNKYKSIDSDSIEPPYDINPSPKRFEFEPTMVTEGGQGEEGEEEGEEGEEEGEEGEGDEDLPDDYKAYFTMRVIGSVKVKFDIEVLCESVLYQTDPDGVSFTPEITVNEVAVFSSETSNLVKNTFEIDNTIKESEEFNEDINKEYLNEYENILEEREYEDAKANAIYDQTYNRSLDDKNRRIREAEYLRNQLITGGLRKYFTRKIVIPYLPSRKEE